MYPVSILVLRNKWNKIKRKNNCSLVKFEKKLSNRFVDYIGQASHPLLLDFGEDRGSSISTVVADS